MLNFPFAEMALIEVKGLTSDGPEAAGHCARLERGDILFFPTLTPGLDSDDLAWLLSAKADGTSIHKNISYRPAQDIVRGFSSASDEVRLLGIMREYSTWATEFVAGFLKPYASQWSLDYASFRPLEEAGRDLPTRKSNELLHVDAFPSRPTHGGRILRFFSNINPTTARVWKVGGGFDELAADHAEDAGLSRVAAASGQRRVKNLLGRIGLPLPVRSAYDQFMLGFHDYLKENADYQANTQKIRLEFPPGSSWIVYTDCVPHAALSGQYALEQTFIIPQAALVAPETSPLSILERLAGRRLVNATN